MDNGKGWKQFVGKETPSTVELSELFYDKVPRGTNVVDFGCAWGRIGFELQAKGYQVSGFDMNENAIQFARENALETNKKYPEKLDFITANAMKLPYNNHSFDACIMQAFLTTIISPEARKTVINEASRILVDNGILYLADFGQNWKDPHYRDRYLGDYPVTNENGTFMVTEDGKPGGRELFLVHHYSDEELKQLLEKKFQIETIQETTFTTFHGNRTLGYILIATKKD